MARTVAEIDGDSSGLVSELGQAKKAMADLGTQGKKLSDQLKDVADQADVAAGDLVNKLGGPGAIKAIAGVGIAFGGMKVAVDAFMDSAENMFRGMGAEGQAVWDQTEKSLFAVKGALAEAVLGTDDMYEAGGKMTAAFGLVKDAVDTLLIPVKALAMMFEGLLELTTDYGDRAKEAAKQLKEQAAQTTAAKTSADSLASSLKTLNEKYLELTGQTAKLNDIRLAGYQLEAKMLGEQIMAEERASDKAEALAAVAGRQEELNKLVETGVGYFAMYDKQGNDSAAREAERVRLTKIHTDAFIAEELRKREGMSAARKAQYDDAVRMYLEFENLRMQPPKPEEEGGKTGKAGGEKPEEKVDGMEAEQRARNEMAAILNANDKMEQQLTMDKLKALDDRINAETERKKAAIDAVNEYALEMERQHDAELHAQGKLTVKEQEELDKARLEQAKSYLADYTTAFMQSQGRQLAIGKLSAKEAGDFARKQLGNAIMGLGDKAMAEAGIMAASLNPLAIPMAAAGVAAYAVGSALNADKKQVATEPPTEVAGAQAQPASYSFNLQVDSVFADGESVARQFARMQESARQRGLLTQGAY